MDNFVGFFTGPSGRISDVNFERASVALEKLAIHRAASAVGVLAATSTAVVTHVHVAGTVTVKKNMSAGGLIGLNYGFLTADDANVSVHGENTGLGGLVAGNEGTISECHAEGSVVAESTLSNNATGGLVGGLAEGSIVNSYSLGKAAGAYWAGGLVGYYGGGSIASSYSTGKVKTTQYAGICRRSDRG
jgi:hypothetical protein